MKPKVARKSFTFIEKAKAAPKSLALDSLK